MSKELARRFVDALHALEEGGSEDALVDLFTERCEVANRSTTKVFRGKEGARQFWRDYAELFDKIHSEFKSIIASGDRIALEWRSTGVLRNGQKVDYEGVSVLYLDDDRIARFTAYFDPTELPISEPAGRG